MRDFLSDLARHILFFVVGLMVTLAAHGLWSTENSILSAIGILLLAYGIGRAFLLQIASTVSDFLT